MYAGAVLRYEMMADQGRIVVMEQEEKDVITEGYRLHRNNYVRVLAYVRTHLRRLSPAGQAVYEGRRPPNLRRRIRDFVTRTLQE